MPERQQWPRLLRCFPAAALLWAVRCLQRGPRWSCGNFSSSSSTTGSIFRWRCWGGWSREAALPACPAASAKDFSCCGLTAATELRLVLSAWRLRTDAGRVPSESVPTAARDISRCGCDWPLAAPSVLIVLAAARTARCLSVVGVLWCCGRSSAISTIVTAVFPEGCLPGGTGWAAIDACLQRQCARSVSPPAAPPARGRPLCRGSSSGTTCRTPLWSWGRKSCRRGIYTAGARRTPVCVSSRSSTAKDRFPGRAVMSQADLSVVRSPWFCSPALGLLMKFLPAWSTAPCWGWNSTAAIRGLHHILPAPASPSPVFPPTGGLLLLSENRCRRGGPWPQRRPCVQPAIPRWFVWFWVIFRAIRQMTASVCRAGSWWIRGGRDSVKAAAWRLRRCPRWGCSDPAASWDPLPKPPASFTPQSAPAAHRCAGRPMPVIPPFGPIPISGFQGHAEY